MASQLSSEKWLRGAISVGALVGLCAWSGTAGAQAAGAAALPAAAPNSDVQIRADALIRRGIEFRRQGREQEALASFGEAFELAPSPRSRGQMGLAAKSLSLFVEAERYLSEALSVDSDAWVAQNRLILESARGFVGSKLGTVEVQTDFKGLLVINGARVIQLPLLEPVRVVVGELDVEIRVDGYQPYRYSRKIEPLQRVTLRPSLVPIAAVASNDPGLRRVPLAIPAASKSTFTKRMAVDPVRGGSRPSTRRVAAIATGVTSLAALGTSGYFALRALSLKEQRDAICPEPRCPTRHGVVLDDRARDAARISSVSLSFGVLLAGAFAYLHFAESAPASGGRSGARRNSFGNGGPAVSSGGFEWVF